MKTQDLFTEQDLIQAVDDLATVPYFPTESRGSVMTQLRRMCPHRTALRWLVAEVVNHVGSWPGGASRNPLLPLRRSGRHRPVVDPARISRRRRRDEAYRGA